MKNSLHSLLSLWIDSKDPLRKFSLTTSAPLAFWSTATLEHAEWVWVSDLFHRLAVSATSEADCERYLSKIKLLIHFLRHRLTPKSIHRLLCLASATPS
jgi:hypothetical protein